MLRNVAERNDEQTGRVTVYAPLQARHAIPRTHSGSEPEEPLRSPRPPWLKNVYRSSLHELPLILLQAQEGG